MFSRRDLDLLWAEEQCWPEDDEQQQECAHWRELNHYICRLLGTPAELGHRAQSYQHGTGRRSRVWWAAGGAKPRPCPIVDNLLTGGRPLSLAESWGLK